MTQEQIEKIIARLTDHENRLKKLEGAEHSIIAVPATAGGKLKTLREIIKGKNIKNGQEQIAAIVGYYEKVLGHNIPKEKIKEEWVNSKMDGAFSAVYFSRAKDALIRVHPDDTCDLTQSGEEFFDKLLNNESASSTSK